MKHYEYKVLNERFSDALQLENALNKLGKDGWYLVGAIDSTLLYFVREKEEKPDLSLEEHIEYD